MSRFILAFLLLLGAYWIIRKLGRSSDSSASQPGPRTASPSAATDQTTEKMVQCRQCGVHVPCNEVVFSAGFTFCSTEHRDQYLQTSSGQ